jgi:hypothetical protein
LVQNDLNLSPKGFFPIESRDIPYEVWLLSKDCQNDMSDDIGIQSKSNFEKMSMEEKTVDAKMTEETYLSCLTTE